VFGRGGEEALALAAVGISPHHSCVTSGLAALTVASILRRCAGEPGFDPGHRP